MGDVCGFALEGSEVDTCATIYDRFDMLTPKLWRRWSILRLDRPVRPGRIGNSGRRFL